MFAKMGKCLLSRIDPLEVHGEFGKEKKKGLAKLTSPLHRMSQDKSLFRKFSIFKQTSPSGFSIFTRWQLRTKSGQQDFTAKVDAAQNPVLGSTYDM